MPRYYFNSTGSFPFEDREGTQLIDDQEAWSNAVRAMGELLRDIDDTMPERAEILTTVLDSNRVTMMTLQFTARKNGRAD